MTDNFYERYWAERKDYLDDFALKWPKLSNISQKKRNRYFGFWLRQRNNLKP